MLRVLIVVALVLAALQMRAAPASADFGDPSTRGPLRSIVFPVVGPVHYSDTYGAPRGGGRSHAGQDLMASKMQPLVAAASGTVTWMPIPEPSYGYMLTITGDDGWSYNYVHINNDSPGTDDGRAQLHDVFAPGVARGARVEAGQLVAFVGDSGNAEDVAPQLHFEMEDPTGRPVNPMASLDAAARVEAPGAPAQDTGDPEGFDRIAGADRAGTAIAVSQAGWPAGSVPRAVVAAGSAYGEALAASVLAAQIGSPLLLDGPAVATRLEEELRRLGTGDVVVVGSVARSLDAALGAAGMAVERIGVAGDPVATAAAVARRLDEVPARILVVNGASFADGIAAASLGSGAGWPILLSGRDRIPQVSVDVWRELGAPAVTVVGGAAVVGDNVMRFLGADRIAGDDRYGTSIAAAEATLDAGRSLGELLLATGTSFPDAVSAGPLAVQKGGVTVLVDGRSGAADGAVRQWLADRRPLVDEVHVLGGPAAVAPLTLRSLAQALAG